VRRARSLLNAPTLGVFRECWADLTVLGSFQAPRATRCRQQGIGIGIECKAGECGYRDSAGEGIIDWCS
jgi:hypothetical protein